MSGVEDIFSETISEIYNLENVQVKKTAAGRRFFTIIIPMPAVAAIKSQRVDRYYDPGQ
jgi:hypothetical protein